MELGSNRYTVLIGEVKENDRYYPALGEQWDQLQVVADVSVSTIQTPEPGTAVIAASGLLSGLGLIWNRSRRQQLTTSDSARFKFVG